MWHVRTMKAWHTAHRVGRMRAKCSKAWTLMAVPWSPFIVGSAWPSVVHHRTIANRCERFHFPKLEQVHRDSIRSCRMPLLNQGTWGGGITAPTPTVNRCIAPCSHTLLDLTWQLIPLARPVVALPLFAFDPHSVFSFFYPLILLPSHSSAPVRIPPTPTQ